MNEQDILDHCVYTHDGMTQVMYLSYTYANDILPVLSEQTFFLCGKNVLSYVHAQHMQGVSDLKWKMKHISRGQLMHLLYMNPEDVDNEVHIELASGYVSVKDN